MWYLNYIRLVLWLIKGFEEHFFVWESIDGDFQPEIVQFGEEFWRLDSDCIALVEEDEEEREVECRYISYFYHLQRKIGIKELFGREKAVEI